MDAFTEVLFLLVNRTIINLNIFHLVEQISVRKPSEQNERSVTKSASEPFVKHSEAVRPHTGQTLAHPG